MSIKVISQNTNERKAEMEQLFEDCRPYLENGMGLAKAVQKARNYNHHHFYGQKWFKELRKYAEQQGYPPRR